MFRRAVTFAAAVGLAFAAQSGQAQDRAAALRHLLARVPEAVLSATESHIEIEFGDTDAGAVALRSPPDGAGGPFLGPSGAFLRSMPARLGEAWMPEQGAGWPDLVGFAPGQVGSVLSISSPPLALSLIRLTGDASAIPDTLARNGYRPEPFDAGTAWVRGAEDFAIDLAARNPSDPFGRNMGLASRIVIDGDLLLQSSSRAVLAALTSGAQSLADHSEVAGLLSALDAPEAGEGDLVRAWLIADPTVLSPTRRPATWGRAILADLSDGKTETAILALVYPTSDLARAATAEIAERWHSVPSLQARRPWSEIVEAPPVLSVVDGGGVPVLLIRIDTPTAVQSGRIVNIGVERLLRGLYSLDLVFLPP